MAKSNSVDAERKLSIRTW